MSAFEDWAKDKIVGERGTHGRFMIEEGFKAGMTRAADICDTESLAGVTEEAGAGMEHCAFAIRQERDKK